MKIGFLGDLHFNHKNYKDMHQALKLAMSAFEKENVDVVVQLGDIYDHFNISTGQTSVATIVKAAIQEAFDLLPVPIYIIEGNHDQNAKGSQESFHRSSIQLLENNHITAVLKPEPIELTDQVVLLPLPWQSGEAAQSVASLIKAFNSVHTDKFKVLCGHFLTEGATQHGYEVKYGDFYISKSQLKKFGANIIAAGHIHHRQGVYAGIIMHNNLSDAGAPTGVRIVDFNPETKEIRSDKFIELKTPKQILIELDEAKPEKIEQILSSVNDYDYYTIRIKDKQYRTIPTPPNVEIKYRPENPVIERLKEEQVNVDTLTTKNMFEIWAKRAEYSEDMIKEGLELLREYGVV